ncbi:S24 family peptidase [Neolewinella persica]|uniref:S24 family peptidase n=1 Tax=Neolewinella persica TaxID=70998 RepID=UPI00036C7D7D|nr:S24 family peptidase [Neolewinella persica]
MIKGLIPYWQTLFAESPLSKFLKEVINSFDEDEITSDAVMQLHRFTQLAELRKEGVIDSGDYIQRLSEISNSGKEILKKINENYLPILPIKAVAGLESGPHYTVEYHDIEDWRHLPKRNSNKKVGIRVDGDSMNPIYEDGDVIMCKKAVIEEITERQAVIVVCKDNSIFLKNIKKEGSKLWLKSLNPAFEPFQLHLREILEIWAVETKV